MSSSLGALNTLPAELRIKVYRYVLPPAVQIVQPISTERERYKKGLALSLIRTSQVLREESLEVLFAESIFNGENDRSRK